MSTRPFRYQWEWSVVRSGLPSRARHVGLTMAIHSDSDGTSIRPGVRRIAAETGLSQRTVDAALHDLRNEGYLARIKAGRWRSGEADEYRLTIPPTATAAHNTDRDGDVSTAVNAARAVRSECGTTDTTTSTPSKAEARTEAAPQNAASIEAALTAERKPVTVDPLRSSPPRTPQPKDAVYSRRAHEREAREQGFDPMTGEYVSRSERPLPRSRRR